MMTRTLLRRIHLVAGLVGFVRPSRVSHASHGLTNENGLPARESGRGTARCIALGLCWLCFAARLGG